MPVVSFLMTAKNAEEYVALAIQSALAQSFEDFEVVFVDDGSTDHTLEIARSIDDPRMRIISLGQPVGRTPALNIGLEAACGTFVAVLDADDLAEPNRLQIQLDYLKQYPDVVMLGGGYKAIDQHGVVLSKHHMPLTHQDILDCLPLWNPMPHSTMTYRREQIINAGLYPNKYHWAQDFGLILNIAKRHRIANISAILGSIRMHTNQMTQLDEFELNRLHDTYWLFRKARSIPGVPIDACEESIRREAEYAHKYTTSLKKNNKYASALLFRTNCILRDLVSRVHWKRIAPPKQHSNTY